MARRYFFTYGDKDGNNYTASFTNPNYLGEEVQLTGSAALVDDLSGDPFQPLQGKRYAVTLKATKEEPLTDLYTEDDRYWLFRVNKLGEGIIFQGYAYTQDMEQSYNEKAWYVNFNCMDHLTYLADYGYYDADGFPYIGNATVFQVIVNCLAKGFNSASEQLRLRIMHYLRTSDNELLFQNTYIDQAQFYDEDGEAEDCAEILEQLLGDLGCFIRQENLHWLIMPVKDYVESISRNIVFRVYDTAGNYTGTYRKDASATTQRIGDHINNLPTYHVNTSSYSMVRLYNTFRVRHEFTLKEQVFKNPTFQIDGGTISDWFLGADATAIPSASNGVRIASGPYLGVNTALSAFDIDLREGDVFKVEINTAFSDMFNNGVGFNFIVELTSGADVYRLARAPHNTDLYWRLPSSPIYNSTPFFIVDFDDDFIDTPIDLTIDLPPLPADGVFSFKLTQPYEPFNSNNANFTQDVFKVALVPVSQGVEAEEFTVSRTDKTTGQVPEVHKVRFNTVDRNILQNVFLDADGEAMPYFINESTAAQVTMAVELAKLRLRTYNQNNIYWRGGVKNNYPFSVKRIDNIGVPFIVVSENKDYTTNISEVEMLQVGVTDPPTTIEINRVYRDAIQPTLKIT